MFPSTGCIDQVNNAPPSGVQVVEYGPYIQELFNYRNTKFGYKPFMLHHCYKELCKNEKWIQKITETTPKRSRLSISVEEDNEVDKDANNRPEGNKIAKQIKKINAFGGTYKEELMAMIETKKVLAAERKEEKMARWNELKMLEDGKWKAELEAKERKMKGEEHRLALEEERIRGAKKAEERAIMFMNPYTMDETARKYWELTHGEILEASL
ncbi:uncharacterized protein [Aegilops tauschii subsp. strangulata]|uniref:uncharacterized protein n=1 Tax=Aegilops tauschii subsp. strangulata TaxID=200361 RepID=UPI003CC84402